MSWLSKLLFGDRDEVKDYTFDQTEEHKPVVTKPDIGEPVYSFVQCVLDNPRRFQLRKLKRQGGMSMSRHEFMFTDRVTLESWTVMIDYRWEGLMSGVTIDWLTVDESKFIAKSIAELYNNRRDKLCILRNQRNRRKTQSERDRLKGVYCAYNT